ncbi:unnamed protein product [Scytosiphon promiscuus]
MAPATSTRGSSRATGFVLTVALAVCSCGGRALGFVAPPTSSRAACAAAGQRVAAHGAIRGRTTVAAATRPRVSFRLDSSKGPSSSSGGGGGTDFMDSIGGVGRELTTEEKIAALQQEVQAQAAMVAEIDEKEEDAAAAGPPKKGVVGRDEVAIPGTVGKDEKEEEESSAAGFFSGNDDFEAEEGFVDEGKNILWPNPRRAAQLTLLAVVAQLAFIVYIISLNSFLNSFPAYFEKFIEVVKSGDWSSFRLPNL